MKVMNKMLKFQDFIPWSEEEINQFLKVADSEGKGLMYEFVLNTGLRQGELLALSWRDIDFKEQTVVVSRNMFLGENGVSQIKNGSRTLILPRSLVTKLQKHKEKLLWRKKVLGEKYYHKLDLVFPNKNGDFQKPSFVTAQFYRLISNANVREINFHGLRRIHFNLLKNVELL